MLNWFSSKAAKYHALFWRMGPPAATLLSQLKSSWLTAVMLCARSSSVRLLFCSFLLEPYARQVPENWLPPSLGIASIRTPDTADSADCDPTSYTISAWPSSLTPPAIACVPPPSSMLPPPIPSK